MPTPVSPRNLAARSLNHPHVLAYKPRFAIGQSAQRGVAWYLFASRKRREQAVSSLAELWMKAAEHRLRENEEHLRQPHTAAADPSARYRALVHHRLDRRPVPRSRERVTPREAELLVRDWMRHMGARDAEVTQFTGDGGVDVISRRYIAQVKHYTGPVGVAAIRELRGVASVDGRAGLFFARSGYTPAAIAFAEQADIALFVYSDVKATLTAMNSAARRVGHSA